MGIPRAICKEGHPLDEKNSIYKFGEWPSNGRKQCRICTNLRNLEYKRERKNDPKL